MIRPQEAMRQKAIKDAEKERANFYQKQKDGQKDARAKYREKVCFTFINSACNPNSNSIFD